MCACGCRTTNSYPAESADAEWILSLGERVALATTGGTDKMPGGMERLSHVNEYKTDF